MEHEAGSDPELVAAFLRTRDEFCFRLLFRRHTPALLLLARRTLGGEASHAEDAVQESWVRAIRGLPNFRGDCKLRTWLCGIVINCCREMRRSARETSPLSEEQPESMHPPMQPGEPWETEALLRALPDGYREVVVLHEIEGYTHVEIAAMLGIDPGTSKSQLSRARALLRRWISDSHAKLGKEAG